MVYLILEIIEEKLFDSSATSNQICGKMNILLVIQFVCESWREISCTTVMNRFAHCGLSNFVCLLTSEFNEQFLSIQNHNDTKCFLKREVEYQ